MAREREIPCLIDAAQSAGRMPIDVQALGADFVAFPGHKGLLGPLGTGVLYVRPGMENKLPTMKEGGTGTVSERPFQPQTMPDKYETGSHNAIGLAGLSAGVAWLLERGVSELRKHDERLCELFMELTERVENLTVYGPRDVAHRAGIFSVNVGGLGPDKLAAALEEDFGLCTRAGVHCAPLAHKTIGAYPAGACRLSFGAFTTEDHVRRAAAAIAEIARRVTAGQHAAGRRR
jgi:selenocysteine lyase/cysteine desulfurase